MRLSERFINAIDGDGVISSENAHVIEDAVNFIRKYEDAEEQGRLVILPCKVGDAVYEVVKKRVDLTGYRMEWGWETVVEAVKFRIGMTDSVGKTVFLTRKEAEAALNNKIEKEN